MHPCCDIVMRLEGGSRGLLKGGGELKKRVKVRGGLKMMGGSEKNGPRLKKMEGVFIDFPLRFCYEA